MMFNAPELQKMLQESADAFKPYIKEPLRIPLPKPKPYDKIAFEIDVDKEVIDAFRLYKVDETKLTDKLLEKKSKIQIQFIQGLEDIRYWAKKEALEGEKSIEDIAREGDQKLQALKVKIDNKLQDLKKEGFREFDALEKKHIKKTPALIKLLKFTGKTMLGTVIGIGKFAGKQIFSLALKVMTVVLLLLAAKEFLLPYLYENAGAMAKSIGSAAKEALL